jgi:hypothetical protein
MKNVTRRQYRIRCLLLGALGLGALAVTLVLPPIAQWADYHDFADARAWGLLPNALNVLSNLPFLVVGGLGLWYLRAPSESFGESGERGPTAVLMLSFVLVGVGSSYYHWQPDDSRLVWDRLGLALIFSSILGITLIERVSLPWGRRLFLPLLGAGVASVLYWHLGTLHGQGDLRYYALVQGGAVLAVPLVILLFPARYSGGRELLVIVALYGAAKVFEIADRQVFQAGHLVSGHTLKHLLSGLAAWRYLRMVRVRRPVDRGEAVAPAVEPAAVK